MSTITTVYFESPSGAKLNTVHLNPGQQVRIAGTVQGGIPLLGSAGGYAIITLTPENGEFFPVRQQVAVNALGDWYWDVTLPNVNAAGSIAVSGNAGQVPFNQAFSGTLSFTIGTGSYGEYTPTKQTTVSSFPWPVVIIGGIAVVAGVLLYSPKRRTKAYHYGKHYATKAYHGAKAEYHKFRTA